MNHDIVPFVGSRGASQNDLWRLAQPSGQWVVKVYRGPHAQARRDREANLLTYWKSCGQRVPELRDITMPALKVPHMVLSYVQGPSLRKFLADRTRPLEEHLRSVDLVLTELRRRHERAMSAGDLLLIHHDLNSGNVLLSAEGPVWIDLEHRARSTNILDAVAKEVAKLTRWITLGVSPRHLDEIARRIADAYAGRHEVLERIHARVCGRRLQAFHRWRDYLRKRRAPNEVTKYDVANALTDVLHRRAA